MHEQTKAEATKVKDKLHNDLYFEKKVKEELEAEIEAKLKEIKGLKS